MVSRKKNIARYIMIFALVFGSATLSAKAMTNVDTVPLSALSREAVVNVREESNQFYRASGSFDMKISSGSIVASKDNQFPLETGEIVTIDAIYSPKTASVDFGVIAPDGYFYYIQVKNGSINKAIEVDERGYYTLAIRNNSSHEITVKGFVYY